MNIALVDDDKNCLDEMAALCRAFSEQYRCHVEISAFTSGEAFLDAFEDGGFSVVFMDIYMDGIDGIDTALKMRGIDNKCLLVFVTSSAEFMPDAFSCHAFEYITKPFSPQRIPDVLADALKVLPVSQKYIEIANGRKTVRILLDDITAIMTDAHYLDITLVNGQKLRCRMTMSQFLERTQDDPRFIAVNKGITVNAEHIRDFADNCCVMENGTRFPMRVRDRLKIEQAALDYNFSKIHAHQGNALARYHGKENGL